MALDRASPYLNLDRSKSQFRLLRILPSDQNNVHCELRAFSLIDDALPPYKALSYRWGDDETSQLIHIGDYPIPIRSNLYTIMTQMLAEERRDWLFIDALCIDQSNEAEKPGQVSLMGEVYRRAEAVIAWLVYEPGTELFTFGGEEGLIDPGHGTNDISAMPRHAVEQAVLCNSYWTRLWIVQEVLLAKCLIIRMGSIEVAWLNLIPEKDYFDSRGLPDSNANLVVRRPSSSVQISADKVQMSQGNQARKGGWKTRSLALNILSHRRYKTRSLRAGSHLPFHRAFRFFATQQCGRLHDRVFGYIGLTSSRIPVDYSLPILDLFVATLGDYLLSAGLITEDHRPVRKRIQLVRGRSALAEASDLIAPVLAFDLDLYDPLVHVLFCQVAQYFAPGFEDSLFSAAMGGWWVRNHPFIQDFDWVKFFEKEFKFEFMYIGSACIKAVKTIANESSAMSAKYKELVARKKRLAYEDAVLVDAGSGRSMRHSEWIRHADSISEMMWLRYQESGEDADGDLDDESWTMIA